MDFLANEAAMIGVIALICSILTELTKNIGFLAKIPTVLQVIVTAVLLSVVEYCARCTTTESPILWYIVIAKVIVGIIAAFVATYGWDKLHELIQRFTKSKEE